MNIQVIKRGPAGSNCYVCIDSGQAFVIDPGCGLKYIKSALDGARLSYVFLTHSHYDHVASLDELRAKFPEVTVYAHEAAAAAIIDPVLNGSVLFGREQKFSAPDKLCRDGDIISHGDVAIEIIHTPGHSRGSICLLAKEHIFTGDTLFKGSIGRSDFPGGDKAAMMRSIDRLMSLEGDLKVWPGHGPDSTLEYEREKNPFFRRKRR